MRLGPTLLAVSVLALFSARTAAAQNPLERARTLYNEARYEEAIAAATEAAKRPAVVPSATLVIARSRLERFRTMGDASELKTARTELVSIDRQNLGPQEVIEWQIGVATVLFLENQFGPAAEMLTSALETAHERLAPAEYEKLLEWWGTSMTRLAETLTGDARKRLYEQFQDDARRELERNPLSRPATYWTIVALRGAGQFDAAWNAAIAGWIRAGAHDEGRQLRADLDSFVKQTLIPERAQARTGQRSDAKATVAESGSLAEEWRVITARWSSDQKSDQSSDQN